MTIMKSILIICGSIMLSTVIFAQQCAEPDATIWQNSWHTCQKSVNPNPARGTSHWIQYDLGQVRTLSKSWIWNTNDPSRLDEGFKEVQIDFSVDGETWMNFGQMVFPKGKGTAVYGGFPGPDLSQINARYILITALSNYGNASCYGLTEVKFNLLPNSDRDTPELNDICSAYFEGISVDEVGEEEALISWGFSFPDEEEEDYFYFPVQFRPRGTQEWDGQLAEEAMSVILEELEPNTTYEYRIGTVCGELITYTNIRTFTTEEGEVEDCEPVSEIEVEEVTDGSALIYWEEVDATEGYLLAYREVDSEEEWQTKYTVEPFLELSDLQAETDYEIYIAIFCEEEELWNDETPLYFSTNAGGTVTNIDPVSASEIQWQVYPNPSRGMFIFDWQGNSSGRVTYRVLDSMGRQHLVGNINRQSSGQMRIDLLGIPDGVYFLQLSSEEYPLLGTRRLVKISQ